MTPFIKWVAICHTKKNEKRICAKLYCLACTFTQMGHSCFMPVKMHKTREWRQALLRDHKTEFRPNNTPTKMKLSVAVIFIFNVSSLGLLPAVLDSQRSAGAGIPIIRL